MTTIVEQGRAQPTESKSLYISHAVSNFYGTKLEMWAGFGPVRNVLKKMDQLLAFFGFFMFSDQFSQLNNNR